MSSPSGSTLCGAGDVVAIGRGAAGPSGEIVDRTERPPHLGWCRATLQHANLASGEVSTDRGCRTRRDKEFGSTLGDVASVAELHAEVAQTDTVFRSGRARRAEACLAGGARSRDDHN